MKTNLARFISGQVAQSQGILNQSRIPKLQLGFNFLDQSRILEFQLIKKILDQSRIFKSQLTKKILDQSRIFKLQLKKEILDQSRIFKLHLTKKILDQSRNTSWTSYYHVQSGSKAEGVEKKKKVGENNGLLRFVHHHGWRTQARLARTPLYSQVLLRLMFCSVHVLITLVPDLTTNFVHFF